MREPTEVISFDLDSTLYNTEHRWGMIDRDAENGPDFWNKYSLACVDDTPGPAMPIAQYLSRQRAPFIIVSGRSEIARPQTMAKLHADGIFPWAVFMCDDRHDYMPHGAWKALRISEIQAANNWRISMHFDDVSDVAIEVEKLGIPVILVHTIGAVADHLG